MDAAHSHSQRRIRFRPNIAGYTGHSPRSSNDRNLSQPAHCPVRSLARFYRLAAARADCARSACGGGGYVDPLPRWRRLFRTTAPPATVTSVDRREQKRDAWLIIAAAAGRTHMIGEKAPPCSPYPHEGV